MGGDHGPPVVVPAALHVLTEQEDLKLILVGDRQVLASSLHSFGGAESERLVIHHASQVAAMGAALTGAVENIPSPRVGLLNIGAEEIKGNERVKEAGRLLAASELNYIGFIEGDDIYGGDVDVVVCDGFIGNVALKTSEGVARMIRHYMEQEFRRSVLNTLVGAMALPVLKSFRAKIDPRQYNGASLLGLQGIVIKSHGGADIVAYANAIKEAVVEVRKAVPQRISKQLEELLVARRAV